MAHKARYGGSGKGQMPQGTVSTKSGSAEGEFPTKASSPKVPYLGNNGGGSKAKASKSSDESKSSDSGY